MTRTPFPAVTAKCANPACDEEVTPDNAREGTIWAGMEFAPRTLCHACHQWACDEIVRGVIAVMADRARQAADVA